MRPLLAIIGVGTLAATLALAAATRDAPVPPPSALPTRVVFATADPAVTARVDAAGSYGRIALDDRPDRTRRIASRLRLPIVGVELPTDVELLPNAPRDFRAGWHEGIDF